MENGTEDGGKKSSLCPRYSTKRLVVAFAGRPLETGPEAYRPKGYWDTLKNFADAFYRFSRPHTVIGTVSFLLCDNSEFLMYCNSVGLLS